MDDARLRLLSLLELCVRRNWFDVSVGPADIDGRPFDCAKESSDEGRTIRVEEMERRSDPVDGDGRY